MMQYLDLEPTMDRLYKYRDDLIAYAAVQANKGIVEAA
jgi:hypothetical protein